MGGGRICLFSKIYELTLNTLLFTTAGLSRMCRRKDFEKDIDMKQMGRKKILITFCGFY